MDAIREFFEKSLPAKFEANPDLASDLASVYQFELGDDGGSWTVDLTGTGAVSEGSNAEADCTITCEAEDFVQILDNAEMAMMLFTMGKLTIEGDLTMALQLQTILE